MRPGDHLLGQELTEKLFDFDQNIQQLPGIQPPRYIQCLAAQIVDSIRRIRYISTLNSKQVSAIYTDPNRDIYDPIKAAAHYSQNGFTDESFWQVFIATHFGKNINSGWSLARQVYLGSGSSGIWTWARISEDFLLFRNWLALQLPTIKRAGHFGNHRKYQSLDPFSPTGTGMAIGSYIDWIGTPYNHELMLGNAIEVVGIDPIQLFDFLYNSMNSVVSFGRTAKFDYLTLVGKLGLANIRPGFTYMDGATGPKKGARLLFGGNVNSSLNNQELNQMVSTLEAHLGLYFGMQVLEDSLCNWQKNPSRYRHFSG